MGKNCHKVAIIDADLLWRKNHRFPNLACEKISGYWKDKGAEVCLLFNYDDLARFDHIYISKVFTDTFFPSNIHPSDKIHFGGTGFYFDKAEDLPYEIEHHMPDYHLYDEWISSELEKFRSITDNNLCALKEKKFLKQFKDYTDCSIGFLTRGCFRKCKFCINQKYDHSFVHSPLEEFYYDGCKRVCLLDDNFFACSSWRSLLKELISTGKPFRFRQGLDERLLTDDKCELLFSSNYDGDYIFAFDNIADYDLIHSKLKMIRRYTKTLNIKFYILVGFESVDEKDIESAFRRIALLMQYSCLPYIMRYQSRDAIPWKESKYSSLYSTIARWCNQPSIFKKMSFRQFCEANQALVKTNSICSSMRSLIEFEREFPDIAKNYFDLRYTDFF